MDIPDIQKLLPISWTGLRMYSDTLSIMLGCFFIKNYLTTSDGFHSPALLALVLFVCSAQVPTTLCLITLAIYHRASIVGETKRAINSICVSYVSCVACSISVILVILEEGIESQLWQTVLPAASGSFVGFNLMVLLVYSRNCSMVDLTDCVWLSLTAIGRVVKYLCKYPKQCCAGLCGRPKALCEFFSRKSKRVEDEDQKSHVQLMSPVRQESSVSEV